MAKLPQTSQIRLEDLQSRDPLPQWVSSLLRPINNGLSFLYQAMNKDITFKDNINCQLVEVDVRPEEFPLDIKYTLSRPPFGCYMVYFKLANDPSVTLTDAHYLDWSYDGSSITINNITNTTSNTKYRVRLVIF